jgi:hypothetical protein
MNRRLTKLAFVGAALVSLGLGTAPVVTDIAHASEATVLPTPVSFPLIAQIESCRQVGATVSGLNVRQAPSLSNVMIEGPTVGTWTPITAPVDGYVASRFLGDCD